MNEVEQADQTQPIPFEFGRKYLVKKDYSYLNHAFRKGEEVVFVCQSYDRHAGLTRYWFESSIKKEKNIWHVWDNATESNLHWSDFFEAPVE